MSMLKSVFVCLLLMVTTFGYADGCYKSMEEVLPEITGQQAIIKHKDGIQTMLIESSLDSKAQELGWIVPLPSEPTEVKRVDSNIFAEMNRDMPLKMGEDSNNYFKVFGMAVLALLLAIALSDSLSLLIKVLVFGFFFFMIFLLSTSTLSSAGRVLEQGASVLKDEIVGDYQIKIIKAVDAGALDLWLKENSFTNLSNDEKVVVDDYIKKGWCFSTTKLIRKENGKSTPHPLSFTFPSENVIYPMALTGGEPFFGFFVISDQMVNHPQLDVYLSKAYHFSSNNKELNIDNFYSSDEKPNWGLNSFLMSNLFWDGMVVTRLGASINSNKMIDLVFRKEPYRFVQRTCYSKKTAMEYSLGIGINCINAMLFILIVLGLFPSEQRTKIKKRFGWIKLGGDIVAVLIAFITYATLNTIDLKGKEFKYVLDVMVKQQHASFKSWLDHYNDALPENSLTFKSGEEYIYEFNKFMKENYAHHNRYYDSSFVSAKKVNNQIVVKYLDGDSYSYKVLGTK